MALIDFQEYESNSLTMSSPTLVPDHTTNNTIIVEEDVVIIFADASLQTKKNMTSIEAIVMNNFGNLLQALVTPIQFLEKAINAKISFDDDSEDVSEEEVMRDEIFIVRKLPRFAPHMCSYSDKDIYGSIRTILNKKQFKNFCEKNIFDYFMKKQQYVVQAQLCRYVMTLEVKGSSSSEILICANGTFLNSTPREFAIIIGLNCVSNSYDFIFDKGVPNRMVEKYFNGAEIIQKRQLFLAFTERVWGEKNDADAEKFAILYFLHSFVLSNVETMVITSLHFDLVDSERYKDLPWGSLSFEDLARSLNNRLKAGGQFYLIQGMPLAIQVWLYECCSNVPPKIASKVDNRIPQLLNWKTIAPRPRFEFSMNTMLNDDDKVVFKNIEPTKKELSKLQIPQKDATQHECSVDSDDDFQDPPPRKSNKHSKKKQKVDSSTPVVKKPLSKKQVDSFDEHTQTRTPAPRAAKADGMKTPIF
ncbi:hypothetical protein FXO38_27404 [Capsicum annuum]|nr:hypothetical protein FXO38_27404 [Capsicum annuum]KAF3648125.1 hypothetical protein FXO37_19603 [Capsicum annuum]